MATSRIGGVEDKFDTRKQIENNKPKYGRNLPILRLLLTTKKREVYEVKREIKRGELYYVNLEPVVGSEQGGTRPVLIIQNNVGNKFSSTTIIAAAITSKTAKSSLPTHIALKNVAGLNRDSLLLLEQVRTIDRSRIKGYIGSLDEKTMEKVNKALCISLGLRYIEPNE